MNDLMFTFHQTTWKSGSFGSPPEYPPMSVVQRATPLIITPCKARTWSWIFFFSFRMTSWMIQHLESQLGKCWGDVARPESSWVPSRLSLAHLKVVIAFMLYQLSTSRSQSKRGVVGWKIHLAGDPQKSYNKQSLSLSDKLHFQQQYNLLMKMKITTCLAKPSANVRVCCCTQADPISASVPCWW